MFHRLTSRISFATVVLFNEIEVWKQDEDDM